jgi:16S rRNA (cytosine967-C5)-methyltransferase
VKANSRRTAAFVVARWLLTKEFPANLLPEGADRAFVQDLVYTVIRRLRPLRRILGDFLKTWPKGELEALLYVGAAQILYMDDVPDFAAVNETVDAAKACDNRSIAKVVNGVLRNLIRKRDEIQRGTELETFPNALVRRWTVRFGAADAEKLAAWHNAPAVTYLARRDGTFVALERGVKVTSVPGYAEGDFIVQDPGTHLAVELLGPQPGETVLDACAAPGGKTVQLAWRGANVTACEVNPRRRARLEENLKRLKLDVAVTDSFDHSVIRPFDYFSKVLVDAPCSNTGVLRRRPDARWNWSEAKLAELVKLQGEILDAAAAKVAPGGTLVYSTCSNEPEENLAQVNAFLARHPDFALRESKESIPFETGHDGAFAAALVRREGENEVSAESSKEEEKSK